MAAIPAEGQPFYLHCLSGYRSLIAMSILKARGLHNGTNVDGGFTAIKETRRSDERLRLPFDALIVSRQQHMAEIRSCGL